MTRLVPLLLLLAPSPASGAAAREAACAACLCVPAPRSLEQTVRAASAAFVGTVVGEQLDRSDSLVTRFTFLQELSWKGPAVDTVLVRVEQVGDCGPIFRVGRRYFVVAGTDGGTLFLGPCERESDFAPERLDGLVRRIGRPRFAAPPLPERIPKLQSSWAGSGPTIIEAVIGNVTTSDDQAAARVRVEDVETGLSTETDAHGSFYLRGLRQGWHLVRFTPPEGGTEDHVMLLRCGDLRSSQDCRVSGAFFSLSRRAPLRGSSPEGTPRPRAPRNATVPPHRMRARG